MNRKESTKFSRRRWLEVVALSAGATMLGESSAFGGNDGIAPTIENHTANAKSTSFGPVEQIDTELPNIGYTETGPENGRPVILLHGWPYDIHSYVDVAPLWHQRDTV